MFMYSKISLDFLSVNLPIPWNFPSSVYSIFTIQMYKISVTSLSNQLRTEVLNRQGSFRVERPFINLIFTNKQTDPRLNSWSRRQHERKSVLSSILLLSGCQAHLRFRVEHTLSSNLLKSTGLLSCQKIMNSS